MSGLGTHAQGFMGVAFEATYGTFVPATRFFPIKSESLAETFDNQRRRLIRGLADAIGHVAGWSHVEGSIEMELLEDVLPYFLYVSRNTVVKSGSTPNFTYTTTPAHYGASSSLPTGKKGLSITIVKNGEVFGFTGCVVSGMEISTDNGIPQMKFDILGQAEAVQTLPTATYLATDTPFGAGQYSFEIPTASAVFDVEGFTFSANDNAEAQNRLTNSRYAQWVKFGEREVSLQIQRDFTARTDLDTYKALTSASITVTCTKDANSSVAIKLPAAVMDEFGIDGLSDQGQATMQEVTYAGNYDATTGKAYELIVKCQTDIT